MKKITVQLPVDYRERALSPGKTCAILYKSTASSEALGVYNFAPGGAAIVATLHATITSLITVANMGTTSFEVSDDCTMLKIAAKYYYWDASLGTPAYV